jgi:transposase-like protein
MADDLEDPAEAGCPLSSSSPSKRIEDPASLPGGRAPRSGALGAARRRFTPEERAALLAELEASGESVERFALARDLVPATLHKWRYRVRDAQGQTAKPHRVFSPEERRTALEAWSKSGLTAIAFAKLWSVSSESLRAWRKELRGRGRRASRRR